MYYYNQRKYSNVPYPSSAQPNATVATGGCGVCSALMVLNNLYGKEVMTVPQMAQFSINNGAREAGGTDMSTLMNALCKKYALKYKATQYNAELLDCLKSGGMAVINQGDAYQVFSSSGHFVTGYKLSNADTVIVLDPYLYDGKYQKEPKKSRIVKQVGNKIYVKINQISKATQDRNPCYWLVWYTGKQNKPNIKKGQKIKLKANAALYNAYSSQSGVKKIGDFSNFLCNDKAILKKGATVKAEDVKTKENGNVWVKTKYDGGWICVYDYKNDVSKI